MPTPRDEPRRHPWFLVLVALASLGAVPFAFIGRVQVVLWGLPLWLWWSIAFTVCLVVVTSCGLVCYWKDDDLD